MAASGRIRRRLTAAIVLTALIPLLGAITLGQSMVRTTTGRFFQPEIGARLDEALGLYRELAQLEKASMRHQADAIARTAPLRAAALRGDRAATRRELGRLLGEYPSVVSLGIEGPSGELLAQVDRGRPLDEAREFGLDLERPLEGEGGPTLKAVFAADAQRFSGLEAMSEFVDTYGKIAARRQQDERAYVLAFAALLGVAIVLAVGAGVLLARGVSRRITALAEATRRVGGGDLTTRVGEEGSDEITELARAFNHMLVEVETSRARIEFLQRIGAWQEMARRLAHEIKNPLTPIQLAVEEVHQRYEGGSPSYRKLLDDTLDVVQTEVGTLGRLVGEFSDFARLPQARLEAGDLARLLREHETLAELGASREAPHPNVEVRFQVPEHEAPAYLDRQMMGRVLTNLVRNAVEALEGAGRAGGIVRVALARAGDTWAIDIEDDGPGIPVELRERIFDPYVTTRADGTGLGLAIVKKVVVEHGGSIGATDSELGGARIRVGIPVAGSAASAAALEAQSAARVERTSAATFGSEAVPS
jgi:two-component system, NtrC family, nitrogen regulation sensor histidine kinase NtrY